MSNEEGKRLSEARAQYVELAFPELKREDFAEGEVGDTEYRNSLVNQYQSMREYEYRLACKRETLDMYNISKDLEKQGVPSDMWAWGGTSLGHEVSSAGPDSYVLNGECVPGIPEMRGAASCAVSACRVNNNIGQRFGVNLRDSYENGAASLYMHDGTPFKYEGEGKEFLSQMLEEGNIGSGTMITRSRRTKEGNVMGHAYTVSDVVRDDKGNVSSIVVVANNANTCKVYSAEEFVNTLYKEGQSSGALFKITATNKFAKDAVLAEIGSSDFENKSSEELLTLINQTRGQIDDNMMALSQIEQTTLGFNSDYMNFLRQEKAMYAQMIRALPKEKPDDVLGRAAPKTHKVEQEKADEVFIPDDVMITKGFHFTEGGETYFDEGGNPYVLGKDGEKVELYDLSGGVVVLAKGKSKEQQHEDEASLKKIISRQVQCAHAQERVKKEMESDVDKRFDESAKRKAEEERRKKGKGEYVSSQDMRRGSGTCER